MVVSVGHYTKPQVLSGASQDLLAIFRNDTPLMDVRAPVEFAQGAFPNASNIPILDDKQRALIGLRYKEAGQEAAIALGLELATPELREQRLQAWQEFCRANPEGYLYCFRGGLRSRTTQQWLNEAGIDYPLIPGGYKVMRRFLMSQLEQNLTHNPWILLSGPTGSGKTRVLQKLRSYIDLEGLARHRGSAFGRTLSSQPSQIDWENCVSIQLLKHCQKYPADYPLIVEDEGRLIGRIFLPTALQSVMKQADLVLLERDLESRVQLIQEDYIEHLWPQYQQQFGAQALSEFSQFVLGNLKRIQKRLGGERHTVLHDIFQKALIRLQNSGDSQGFGPGIQLLLTEYYDPMYQYQLSKRQGQVLFKGNEDDLIAWVNSQQEFTD